MPLQSDRLWYFVPPFVGIHTISGSGVAVGPGSGVAVGSGVGSAVGAGVGSAVGAAVGSGVDSTAALDTVDETEEAAADATLLTWVFLS